jgi:hypothetical protein
MDMLNFVALSKRGGSAFRWRVNLSGTTRDQMLSWARSHDTLAGGQGSDPHGWRNMLNVYGWGSNTLYAGHRVYEDYGHPTFDAAVKHAVRAMAQHRKPVGLLAWAGKHAQMAVGYYGLKGNPFAKNSAGKYTNNFTVSGLYLADPLRSQGIVNRRVSWSTLKYSTNLRIRFRAYLEYDSPYDDPYTSGVKASRTEWYGKWVIIAPVR